MTGARAPIQSLSGTASLLLLRLLLPFTYPSAPLVVPNTSTTTSTAAAAKCNVVVVVAMIMFCVEPTSMFTKFCDTLANTHKLQPTSFGTPPHRWQLCSPTLLAHQAQAVAAAEVANYGV